MTERGASADDVKRRLLEAAVAALRDLTPADLVSAIGTREIARRAGAASTALFYHFGSVEAFAAAVVARVYDPDSLDQSGTLAFIDGVRSAGLPLEDVIALHLFDLRRLSNDPEFRLRHGLWALGGTDVDAAYRHYLTETDAMTAALAQALFDAWGRDLRPPFDARSYMAAQVALLSGLTVRHLVDPEVSTPEVYSRAAAALLLVTLRVRGDRHDMDDRLAEMNYYPTRQPAPGLPGTERRDRTRAVILGAAAELFELRGYDATTIAQIARAAGVGTSTVTGHYPTKPALAAALFRQQAEDRLVARHRGRGGPRDRLTRHLQDVAELTVHHLGHAPAYLTEIVCHAPVPGTGDALRETTRLLVDEALAAGELVSPLEAADVADLLLSTTMSQAIGRPGERARRIATRVAALVLVETTS